MVGLAPTIHPLACLFQRSLKKQTQAALTIPYARSTGYSLTPRRLSIGCCREKAALA